MVFSLSETVTFQTALADWFIREQRDLPWRRSRDSYQVFVSEVMLQQTTVASVLGQGRWEKFLERFPTWKDLATAPEEDVLAEWSGLGYYRRARMLWEAARIVVDQYGGEFPESLTDSQLIPGIGRYTAGAVASFALGQSVPVVDTNIARVLIRLGAMATPVQHSTTQKQLWQMAEQILPKDGEKARLHNFALMELGAVVCRPKSPDCGKCPVSGWCQAYQQNLTSQLPIQAVRPDKLLRLMTAVALFRSDGCILLRRVPPGEWHAGLLALPSVRENPHAQEHRPVEDFSWLPSGCQSAGPNLETRFAVTRHRITLRTYTQTISDSTIAPQCSKPCGEAFDWPENGDFPAFRAVWTTLKDAHHLGLGSPYRQVLSLLQSASEDSLILL